MIAGGDPCPIHSDPRKLITSTLTFSITLLLPRVRLTVCITALIISYKSQRENGHMEEINSVLYISQIIFVRLDL